MTDTQKLVDAATFALDALDHYQHGGSEYRKPAAKAYERLHNTLAAHRAQQEAEHTNCASCDTPRVCRIHGKCLEPKGMQQGARDAALLDFMTEHRVAVIPEFEGCWDAKVYGEEPEAERICSGTTPRNAIRAAMQEVSK
jgi:hypothetical protein